MPAASYSTVRDALKTALDTIDGLTVYATANSTVNPPAAVVLPGDPVISFDSTMARGADDMLFVVRLLVGQQTDYAAQDKIDAYLAGTGPSSVKAAVDGNLGGVVDFARVSQARNYGEFEHPDGHVYLGVEFVIEVTA